MELPAASGGESIKVFVRVRPPDPNLSLEVEQGACLEASTQMTITVHCKPEPRVFTFDHVAGMETTQEDVFSAIGRPIIDSCMCGYNGTVFAYGQTGSGKTFTMIGPSDECDTFTHELRGVIPRSFEYLFSHINREKQMYGDLVEFLCKCSFLEIYNEQVYDLLDPASCGLHLRENIKHGVYVDGLSEVSVSCARDAYEVLSTGWVNRKVASTSMNRESSRSHAVFTLTIESKKRESKNSVAKIKTSLLNLVDLAGSERQRDTRAAGLRLKEAGSINKSLSALGNVIMALVDIAHGKSRHVHYRDSKLTFLLRDSLGGNAKTNLVANVHPSARCFGETLSTLNFARRAKMIKNKAVVNEDASGNVLQLQAEIRRLRERLEHYRSSTSSSVTPSPVSTPMTPSCPFPHSLSSYSMRSDDDKTIAELKEMLSSSLLAREKTESENATLQERFDNLEKLCEKKEKFLQSTKMILKFRETHIGNLEKAQRSQLPPNTAQELAVKLLRGEIEQLKYMVDHHPDVTKFARENISLKAELKKLREAAAARSGGVANKEDHTSRELGRMHKYTLQLERQLRHFLGRNSDSRINSPPKLGGGGGNPPTPSKVTLDLEHLRGRCRHLQEELEGVRRTLSTEREEGHLRVLKLESSLNAAKKTNMELERSIEALKLKSSVEKATLNDIHMNTIKSMLTPRRERERELMQLSKSSPTGSSPLRRVDSDPVKQLNFNGVLSSSAPPTSPYRNTDTSRTVPAGSTLVHSISRAGASTTSTEGANDEMMNGNHRGELPALREEGEGCEDVESGTGDDFNELNIEGALTDELKILQDRNDGLYQQIEDLEVQVSRLSQDKVTLETQLQDLTQLSRSENESAHLREQEYLEKISEMTAKIADLTSTNTVLDSEVVDLRVCLKSADRELAELKADMKKEKKIHDTKTMDLLRRVGELEQLLSSREADYERATEELQNIEDEVDTLRNEITFKEHRISELEQAFVREKGQVTSLEAELQQLLDKLALEVEKNTKLSSELQEGHLGKEKLVSVVNENSSLRGRVEQLEAELESQLRVHKQQMEETEVAMNALLKRQSTDEAAISGFMTTIQELRSTNAMGEAKVASLRQEVDESRKELGKTTTRIDQLSVEVESLQAAMEEQRGRHSKELMKKDSEREIVSEELDSLTEQYQQLESAFESQSSQLSHSNSEVERLRRELETKTAELGKLTQQDKERRASLSRKSSESSRDLLQTVQAKNEEIELLKRRLDSAAGMIDSYEQAWEENKQLQKYKEEAVLAEQLRSDYESLLSTHEEMKDRLSLTEQQLAEREDQATLRDDLEALKAQLSQLQDELREAALSRDKAMGECGGLRTKRDEQRNTIDALNNQLERYKIHEEKLFIEKESLKSQLEAAQEEKAKLLKECESLTKENATITGHRNIRQKIQYHAAIKMENSKLKEEVIQLSGRLRHKSDQVHQLQHMLSGKGHEGVTLATTGGGGGGGGRQKPHPPPAAVPKTHSSDSTMLRLKENVAP